METNALIEKWKNCEEKAHITGWDFSFIEGKYSEDTSFPWDYKETIKKHLFADAKLLDIDTGGGEFLKSLGHPYDKCSATENYHPNVELCKKTLLPLGINFIKGPADNLPFEDNSFDIVINRHGDFCPREIRRVLKRGGVFVTQQVGAENDRELIELLYQKELPLAFPEQYLEKAKEKFIGENFEILESYECKKPIVFYDTEALIWFAKIIEWEFPDFSVDNCLEGIMKTNRIITEQGFVKAHTHRFFLAAKLL